MAGIIKHGRYADVRVDFAFKKCLGTEENKEATIGLLNSIIADAHIADVSFITTELPGRTAEDRKGIIDVLCTDTDGKTFLIEMQQAEHRYFRERTYFYSSLYVQNQARRGEWDFELKPVYVIAFTDFSTNSDKDAGCYALHYRTSETNTGERMPGSAEFFFFDLKDFRKDENELADDTEKWLYLLRNCRELKEMPSCFKGHAFDVFITAAELAGYTQEEFIQYEKDMVTELDRKLALQFAEQKGLARGFAEGKAEGHLEGRAEAVSELALKLKEIALPAEKIAEVTGLSLKEIAAL